MKLIDFYQENKKLYDDILNTIEHCICYYSCGNYNIYKEKEYDFTIKIFSINHTNTVAIFFVVLVIKHFNVIVYEVPCYLTEIYLKKECFLLSLLCKYNKLSLIEKINKTISRK